jgi:hypothetical protein
MAISKIPSAGFQDNVKFRNIIINGDMSIAQRGTSTTGLGNADNGYHTCDRWKFQETGSPTGVFTQSQSTDVPSGQGFATSLKMDCTTADTSLASDDWLKIEHKIEGQNIQYLKYGTSSAQSLTLSFWVKSSKTGTYGVGLFQTGDNRHIESNYTINSADTWEKKIITYSGDTNTAPDNDNTEELRLWFTLLAGTGVSGGTQPTSWSSYNVLNVAPTNQVNLSDSTDNEWYITGVQLEAGETASDFEFLPVDVNLQRCQRYYQVYSPPPLRGISPSGTVVNRLGMSLVQVMRASPSSVSDSLRLHDGASNTTTTSISSSYTSTHAVEYDYNVGSSYSATHRPVAVWNDLTGNRKLRLDAEL